MATLNYRVKVVKSAGGERGGLPAPLGAIVVWREADQKPLCSVLAMISSCNSFVRSQK